MMQPITKIEYDGRCSLEINGPAKMLSHMTVMPEFAYLMRIALMALSKRAPDTHKLELKGNDPIRWQYTGYLLETEQKG